MHRRGELRATLDASLASTGGAAHLGSGLPLTPFGANT